MIVATMMGCGKQTVSLLCLVVILCTFIGSATSAQLAVSPTQRNVLIGDRAEFLCSYIPDNVASCDETFVFWGRKGGSTIANMTYVTDTRKYNIKWRSRVNDGVMQCLYTLVIKSITIEDGGQYSCALIRPQAGRFYIAQALAKVQVVIPPPEIYPICRTSVITGKSIEEGMALVCESETGQPTVSLQWMNGEDILPAEVYKVSDSRLELKTTMALADHDQLVDPLVTCVMQLPSPIDETRSCSINTSTSVTIQPDSVSTAPAEIVTFVCQVATGIPYEIDWYFQNQLIKAQDPHDRFFAETEARALHIRDITSEDEGSQVTCRVTTMFGNFTSTASIAVIDDPDDKRNTLYLDNMPLVLGLIIGSLLLLTVINILVCYTCKRRVFPGRANKRNSILDEECTPMNHVLRPPTPTDQQSVTATDVRTESKYLDMRKPIKEVPASSDLDYSPMKGLQAATNNDEYMIPTSNILDENEYVVSSHSDDPNTYMYSSTDDINKLSKPQSNPKPVVQSKPGKLTGDSSPQIKNKSGPGTTTDPKTGKKPIGKLILPAVLNDNDDANDYEILAKDVAKNPNKTKLHKITSEANFPRSQQAAKASPKLTRNTSAPLLSQSEQPEYTYVIPNGIPESSQQSSSPNIVRRKSPVYDVPNDKTTRTSNINEKINNFQKATEKSSAQPLKTAIRPPVLQKKPHRYSDPQTSSDGEPSPQRRPVLNRTSLPNGDDVSGQYLVPSTSQQNLDKIGSQQNLHLSASQQNLHKNKPTTPPVKEGKSPLLKKAKNPFKIKNNNKETYQCLDRKSRDIEKPDYQVLLVKKTAHVDDASLYENVATGAV